MLLSVLAVGEDCSPETVEAGTVLLWETFRGKSIVGHAESVKLRGIFGSFPATAATTACQLVNRISEWLPIDVLETLTSDWHDSERDGHPEFGKNIRFCYPSSSTPEDFDWLESDEEEAPAPGFDMRYLEQGPGNSAGGATSTARAASPEIGTGWLRRQIELHYKDRNALGMSTNDLCTTLFDILSSSRTDSELQNEVLTDTV